MILSPSPPLPLQADERRYREICAMDDEQEEMLEPLGLGLTGGDSSSSGGSNSNANANANSDAMSAGSGGGRVSGSAPKVKYAIEV